MSNISKWRLAESLEQLRMQINQIAPLRSKSSDGTIGDTAHSNRKSDHNPNSQGVVTAVDITHDPKNGMDCHILASDLITSRDFRIKYLIFNNRMVSSYPAGDSKSWQWRPYRGSNPHTKHIHISVDASPSIYDNALEWNITHQDIYDKPDSAPAYPGSLVPPEEAIKAFQRFKGLEPDGKVGPKTWKALFET